MATKKNNKDTGSPTKDRKFLDKVMKNLKVGIDANKHNVDESIIDLQFLNGDQWDSDEKKRRKNRKRPCLTINMLPEKVDKVVGDMRQNRAKVKVRPVDSQATSDLARIREGIIRDIEYKSMASNIYDYAGGRMVECGEATWRVLTRRCEDNPFVQEIYIKNIKNSFLVVMDPNAEDPFYSDAKWCFVLTRMPRSEFEDTYPNKMVPGDSLKLGSGLSQELWYSKETVTVAEYMEVVLTDKTMCLMEDNTVLPKEDADKLIKDWEREWEMHQTALEMNPPVVGPVPPPPGNTPGAPTPLPPNPQVQAPGVVPQAPAPTPQLKEGAPPKPKVLDTKDTKVRRVKHYVVTACEILEGPKDIPGKYIPIIKVQGKERNIEGKDYVRGLIRDARDPQRLVNYWNTSAAEVVAMAPKAPWVGTAKQFEGYEEDYALANIDNYPFLKYNHDDKAQGPPQRQRPQEPPVAIFTQIQISEKNLDKIAGMGPDMRDVAPDASGKSLIQRQKPHELATFPFVDNLTKAQAYTYRVINEMIPEVYDTERDVQVRYIDGSDTFVPINMRSKDAIDRILSNPDRYRGMNLVKLKKAIQGHGGNTRLNDMGIGKYEVIIDVGPSYATQRQEAADKFTILAQTNPKLWNVAGDLIVKTVDVMYADEISERLRKTIPPHLITLKEGETPINPPPNPQSMLLMERTKTEGIKQKKELIKQQVELVRHKTELIKQYLATQESDKEIRRQILGVLSELHADEHPADRVMAERMMSGQGREE